MVFIVKISKEDLQKIREEIYEGNLISFDEGVIKEVLSGRFMDRDVEVLKIVD